MLSIRRRQGPYEFRKEAFGDPEKSWPNWGELGPILLRSAGIVGLAGVIMMIAAGDTLFREPLRTPSAPTVVRAAPQSVAEPTEKTAAAPANLRTEAQGSREESEAAAAPDVTQGPPPPRAEIAAAAAEAPPPEEAPRKTEIASAPEPAEIDPGALRLEPLEDFDPLAFVSTGTLRTTTEPAGRATTEPAGRPTVRANDPDAGIPPTSESEPAEAAGGTTLSEEDSASEEAKAEVAALSAEARTEPDAVAPRSEDASADELWADEAVECPRDWLSSSAPTPAANVSSDCEPQIVLVAPVGSTESEEPVDQTSLDAALEDAATAHAMELAGFVARLPKARPDPPPVRRVRSNRRADWPAAPPPDCGNLHAYWRFVDREKGTKEWYCR